MADERAALAAEAFIYGFPLVFNLTQIGRFARSGIGEVPATPFNRFGHASELAGPEAAPRANWLPVPDGDFRPILRMYEPSEAVFDGRYELPPITRSP